jgi:hypothetical protein
MKKQTKRNKVVEIYWLDYYTNNLCSLCGNTGIIDTRQTAISHAGFNSGRLNWCICPNGQISRIGNNGQEPVSRTGSNHD